MTCGIYRISEKMTGRSYIGQSKNVELRWRKHHKRFSPDLFTYELVTVCEAEELDFWEIAWIVSERSVESGFNKTLGGKNWDMVFSEDMRQKMSTSAKGNKSHVGRKHSEETKRKMAEAWLRRAPPSEETRRKISKTTKGKKLSEETRQKLSEAAKLQHQRKRSGS